MKSQDINNKAIVINSHILRLCYRTCNNKDIILILSYNYNLLMASCNHVSKYMQQQVLQAGSLILENIQLCNVHCRNLQLHIRVTLK